MIFRAKLFLHFKNSYSFDILISKINFKKYKNIILNKKNTLKPTITVIINSLSHTWFGKCKDFCSSSCMTPL